MKIQTLQTNQVTFLDYTDNRKLDVYIASTLPTTQVYNINTLTHSPDWSSTYLVLSADVYLDSQDITTNAGVTMVWFEQYGTNAKTQVGTGTTLVINSNRMLGHNTFVTYSCEATYQDLTAYSQITFTRVDTGANGADGTSITIKDTAYYNGVLNEKHTGEVVPLLYTNSECTTLLSTIGLSDGDAYIVQGYLCVYNRTKNGFICAGTIQGPPGASAKNIILNADGQVFKVSKNNVITPAIISITPQAVNTNITQWSYSINGGQTFLSTPPTGVTNNGNQVILAGANITSNVIVIKASDGIYSDTYTVYKVFDGVDGVGEPGQPASMAFLTNENITVSANAQGQIEGTTMTTNVVAYNGATKVTPVLGVIDALPEGMHIDIADVVEVNNELILTITIDNNATLGSALSNSGIINISVTSPIQTVLTLSWSKINTGATGIAGIDAVTFQVYSVDGYILSKDTPSITLQTFAYSGDTPIEAGATYQWYFHNEVEWVALTEEVVVETVDEATGETVTTTTIAPITTPYVKIHHTTVAFSRSYMCKMTFGGLEYVDVVTIDDKNDTNVIFTSKPQSYSAGDIWVVGSDYVPEGVELGTVLKAQYTNDVYTDSDWITATKYDDKISDIEADVDTYKQYISLDTTYGIKMNAVDANGRVSEFSTTLSNTQLSFNQADEAVAYINNHKMHITEAEIESPLTVTGKYSGSTMLQAPTINLGDFSLVVESNGSLSIVSNL